MTASGTGRALCAVPDPGRCGPAGIAFHGGADVAKLIDGRRWAAVSRAETAAQVETLRREGVEPGLTVVLVGDNPASHAYVRGKEKAAGQTGIRSEVIRLPDGTTERALLEWIGRLNGDARVHGILVQLPLPAHMRERTVLSAVSPAKDVDGFHAQNAGALFLGEEAIVPCTPLGIMRLLAYEGIDPSGREAVVVGRSNIVGKPVAQLLLRANATVTMCHSRTPDLGAVTRRADILVAAAGRARLVTGGMIKPGAAVIDVGMNRVDGALCGDVDFASAGEVAGAITPVPGGVGPMTIAMLLANTVQAARRAVS